MSRQLVRGVAVLVLYAGLGFHPVHASTVVVPDAFSTVQSAIDSGADTVLIREGTYPERPLVDHAVVLQGIGSQRPRLAGLAITNLWFFAIPRLLAVSNIDFAGRITHTTVDVHPRLLNFAFSDCSLDSGFYQVVSLDPDDVASLTFRRCHLRGQSTARIEQEVMEADTIDGGVSWDTHGDFIQDCWFRGGPGTAIGLTNRPTGTIADNRIEGYDTGIRVVDASYLVIEHNSIVGCGTAILLNGTDVEVRQNDIRDGGIGVDVWGGDAIFVRDNTIAAGRNEGIRATEVSSVVAERNVIERCGGAGILFNWNAWADSIKVLTNTVVDNAGNGLELNRPPGGSPCTVTVENNIAYGNGGWGLAFSGGGPVQVGCNDWFGNGLGSVTGIAAGSTDLFLDPLFCDVNSGDVSLNAASPLLGVYGCGQIGALGVGCGVTATLVRRFTAERASDGVRITWQVAEGATASEVWLERSEAMEGEAWIRPLTERSVESVAVVELDRSAASELTYWYRLVALEGNHAVVIGAPIVVEGQARPEFRLVEVGPNPGRGPVRIAFALKHAAAIEIDVFDVQGRGVASLGRGVWAAGTHVVEWDGRTPNGEVAPTGLYLLRYVYPGGQDKRAIVRMR